MLSSSQQRIWFLCQYMGPTSTFNLFKGWQIFSVIDIDVFNESLRVLGQRQQLLRARFFETHQGVFQICDRATIEYNYESVSTQDELDTIAKFEKNYAFDVKNDSLCRLCLVRDNRANRKNFYVLFVTLHQIIADHPSLNILLADLFRCYQCQHDGTAVESQNVQYSDYSAIGASE